MHTRPRTRLLLLVTTLLLVPLVPSAVADHGDRVDVHGPTWFSGPDCHTIARSDDHRFGVALVTPYVAIHNGQMAYDWTIRECEPTWGSTYYEVTKDHVRFEGPRLSIYDAGPEQETVLVPSSGHRDIDREFALQEAKTWPTYTAPANLDYFGTTFDGTLSADTLAGGADAQLQFDGCPIDPLRGCIDGTASSVLHLG